MEDAKTIFGRRLRMLRKARALTLEELGDAAGIGFKHIAAIERGEKTASFDAIDCLARALSAAPYELFLPYDDNVQQHLARLTRDLAQNGSNEFKQLVVQLLPLLRHFEASARK